MELGLCEDTVHMLHWVVEGCSQLVGYVQGVPARRCQYPITRSCTWGP